MSGQAGAAAAGTLHPEEHHVAEALQPAQQLAAAAGGGGEAGGAHQRAGVVQRGGDVHVELGVDVAGDPIGHAGYCHPFCRRG
jgi:hypothetical protein